MVLWVLVILLQEHQTPDHRFTKITFSNDTNQNLESGCQLTESKYGLEAVSSPTNAYFVGGYVSNYATSVDKIEYASNTVERILVQI